MEVSGGGKNVGVGRVVLVGHRLLSRFDRAVMCASFCKRLRVDLQVLHPILVWLHLDRRYRDGDLESYEVQSTGIKNLKFAQFLEQEMLTVPPAGIQRTFLTYAQPVVDQAQTLALQVEMLHITRDLLLPKLISGEIDVSDLDIDIGEDAA